MAAGTCGSAGMKSISSAGIAPPVIRLKKPIRLWRIWRMASAASNMGAPCDGHNICGAHDRSAPLQIGERENGGLDTVCGTVVVLQVVHRENLADGVQQVLGKRHRPAIDVCQQHDRAMAVAGSGHHSEHQVAPSPVAKVEE